MFFFLDWNMKPTSMYLNFSIVIILIELDHSKKNLCIYLASKMRLFDQRVARIVTHFQNILQIRIYIFTKNKGAIKIKILIFNNKNNNTKKINIYAINTSYKERIDRKI